MSHLESFIIYGVWIRRYMPIGVSPILESDLVQITTESALSDVVLFIAVFHV